MLDTPVAIILTVSALVSLVSAAGGYYGATCREDRRHTE